MIKHRQTSAIADTPDATLVQPSDWNDTHAFGANAFVTVGWAKFQVAAGLAEYPNGIPYDVIYNLTRVAAGHWMFSSSRSTFQNSFVLSGHQVTFRPTIIATPRGALTGGYYFTVYADGDDIHVELWNSSDVNVDPNVRVDITVTIFAWVVAV